MSHQGDEGWFPECLVCGLGHFGPAVCLDPTCHEAHQLKGFAPIHSPRDKFFQLESHFWHGCQLCDRRILSDACSWGTNALCIRCFNAFARAEASPPKAPRDLVRFEQAGIIEWQASPGGRSWSSIASSDHRRDAKLERTMRIEEQLDKVEHAMALNIRRRFLLEPNSLAPLSKRKAAVVFLPRCGCWCRSWKSPVREPASRMHRFLSCVKSSLLGRIFTLSTSAARARSFAWSCGQSTPS